MSTFPASRSAVFGAARHGTGAPVYRGGTGSPLPPPALQCPYSMSNTWLNSTATAFVSQFPTFTDSAAQTVVGVSVATPPASSGSDMRATESDDLAHTEAVFSGSLGTGMPVNIFNSIPRAGSNIIGMEMEVTELQGDEQQLAIMMDGMYDASWGDGVVEILSAAVAVQYFAGTNNFNTILQGFSNDNAMGASPSNSSTLVTTGSGSSGIATLPIRVGIYYNQATKQMGWTDSIHGDWGYFDTMNIITHGTGKFSTERPEIIGFMMYPRVISNGGDIEPCGATMFKHASDWTLTYPAGTTDTCGNVKV